jgi:UMF1 family MFS transporter
MLVAFLLYNDGIQTIIRMASIYGAEVGIDQNAQIAPSCSCSSSACRARFCSAPWPLALAQAGCLPGACDLRRISLLGYFMTSAWQFFVLAGLVGTVQGGSQALSRIALRADDSQAQIV